MTAIILLVSALTGCTNNQSMQDTKLHIVETIRNGWDEITCKIIKINSDSVTIEISEPMNEGDAGAKYKLSLVKE